ncbi:hypothetical protein BSL82_03830 [Tardibacter chloracetimidivorans]|uniref:Uncharacterized protein n=1 Tax=Tardibacter chloracetimidivorans TaxID=1921510 RepID=A0A1L3ZSE0_9SPHN|nr:hypothetical protein [Tardibacter chloracetimidivorans]API58547.1 hypothetical protein BSL82_03830 [Tardibacter chloracetimidivorans]
MNTSWQDVAILAVLSLLIIALTILGACTAPPKVNLPSPPAETVTAKVAVPVDCEIEQVPEPTYPRPATSDIFTLAKTIAADRKVRMADQERLRAANKNPCPAKEPNE